MAESRRILVVEDSAVQATMLRRALQARGYGVEWARNGALGLECARRLRPDLVVADIEMPVLDGYGLCAELRADPGLASIPVILLTNLSDPEDIVRGLNAGADNYVTKPYDEEHLIRRIESLLEPAPQETPVDGVAVRVGGREYCIRSDRQQILNLLISTFESAVQQNRELIRLNVELSRARKELEARAGTLEALNQQKNELLSMAAHDLRNPLGIVMGYSRFLLGDEQPLTEDQRMYVTNIHRSAQFLLHLVEDLLDVSTIESGNLRLNRARLDVGELVAHAVRLNAPMGAAKGIELAAEQSPQGPIMVVDGPKIEQVLNNLITNALKYSHQGTRVLVVLREEPGAAVVEVRDQGQGIPASELGQLFQPFGRTSVQSTGGERSTGLGLAIVRNIVEAHGGRIEVESEVGRGSVFRVTLPTASSG